MSFHDFLNQPPSATPLTPAVPEAPGLIKLLMPAFSSEQSELILFFISVTVNGITCHIDGLQTVNQTNSALSDSLYKRTSNKLISLTFGLQEVLKSAQCNDIIIKAE